MCQLQTQLWKPCIQSELAQSLDTLYPRTNFSDLAVNRHGFDYAVFDNEIGFGVNVNDGSIAGNNDDDID